ncbi:hypothetical protein C5167_019970 [Papaver somniferum]|uniref:Uncharacterized protein n=1 Tax=Papaver somniferum TaxID=3469 RepID=A0A4Y7IUS9_PAPSO|nr:hypothetical protein C5167_019970 [Papaver somniferum]
MRTRVVFLFSSGVEGGRSCYRSVFFGVYGGLGGVGVAGGGGLAEDPSFSTEVFGHRRCYHGYIGDPATPLTFDLCFLRNFMKRPVASSYVDSAELLIDDNYDCMIDEIIDPRVALCDRADAVLGDVSRGDTIKWPQAYVITVGERPN